MSSTIDTIQSPNLFILFRDFLIYQFCFFFFFCFKSFIDLHNTLTWISYTVTNSFSFSISTTRHFSHSVHFFKAKYIWAMLQLMQVRQAMQAMH